MSLCACSHELLHVIYQRSVNVVHFVRLQIQLGVNMPARAEQTTKGDDNEAFGQVYDVVLYLGIIDILQEYNLRKKIEHTYKSIQYSPLSISVVEPNFYSERFLKFVRTIFPESSS